MHSWRQLLKLDMQTSMLSHASTIRQIIIDEYFRSGGSDFGLSPASAHRFLNGSVGGVGLRFRHFRDYGHHRAI
jgi:hypothetical protein